MRYSRPRLDFLFNRGWDGDALFTLLLSLLVGILTLGITHCWLLWRVAHMAARVSSQPARVPALAVLGNQLQADGGLSADYVLRLQRTLQLYSKAGRADILVIGGGACRQLSEAEAGTAYLIESGVDAQQIEKESLSLNTLENFRHARPWFNHHPQALVISNRYHLLRLSTMASGLGLEVCPCAAEEEWRFWSRLPRLLLEAFFLHWYWSGRIFAQLTHNRRMLDKIR